ncbi:alginate lyase family protein [Halalkalirubrum salinum]|uniref:alginate lyase family protein n=1 Tax=Halalkalirubrum salinum TaxID=2563889 RepID=UPI0010FB3904|nr:alginate lyase family protein [Halalkalirubrum salinum]
MAGSNRATDSGPLGVISLYAQTIGRMHTQQLVGIAERTLRERVLTHVPFDFDRRYEARVPGVLHPETEPFESDTETLQASLGPKTVSLLRARTMDAAAGTPQFLNRSLDIDNHGSIDWNDDQLDALPRLWRLKLCAFEPLGEAAISVDPEHDQIKSVLSAFDNWIRSWIRHAEIASSHYLRRDWTPYAVSLRIQHWLRYLTWRQQIVRNFGPLSWQTRRVSPGISSTIRIPTQNSHPLPSQSVEPEDREGPSAFERELAREIYKNALFLRNHVEQDVGGNHLVENGVALIAAGVAFDGEPDAHDWLDTGQSILKMVCERQFLDDGCHFERSPMYHVLVLTRLITACNLCSLAGEPIDEKISTTTAAGAAYLRALRPPDGQIPLLNDSVYDEAIPLDACLRYADRVGIAQLDPPDLSTVGPRPLGTGGGYRWIRTELGSILVDCGPVGPPHLPGHAHSDCLSILLWIDGQPIVTDTGTFDYEAGLRRMYARGVRGHNTVQVGDDEPIDLGGRFLMGRQPKPTAGAIATANTTLFEGQYDTNGYTHRRSIAGGDRWWVLRDAVDNHDGQCIRSRLHLHPSVETCIRPETIELSVDDEPLLTITPLGETTVHTSPGEYFPRFGVAYDRTVITLENAGSQDEQVALGCLLSPPDTATSRSTLLGVDGTQCWSDILPPLGSALDIHGGT